MTEPTTVYKGKVMPISEIRKLNGIEDTTENEIDNIKLNREEEFDNTLKALVKLVKEIEDKGNHEDYDIMNTFETLSYLVSKLMFYWDNTNSLGSSISIQSMMNRLVDAGNSVKDEVFGGTNVYNVSKFVWAAQNKETKLLWKPCDSDIEPGVDGNAPKWEQTDDD